MTPGRGVGANTALRDADLLRRNLIAVRDGRKALLDAVADYEAKMAPTASPGSPNRRTAAAPAAINVGTSASLLYLCIVVGLGLTAALNFQFGFLTTGVDRLLLTHITLGLVGWLSSTLIGVSYTLTRLFALAHSHDDRLGRIVFPLLNISIIGLACGFTFSEFLLIIASGMLLTATVWLFAYDYCACCVSAIANCLMSHNIMALRQCCTLHSLYRSEYW